MTNFVVAQCKSSLKLKYAAAEWGMRDIQSHFGRLRLKLPCDRAQRKTVIDVIVRLHNLRVRRVGLSQIGTVYSPLWEACDLTRGGQKQHTARTTPKIIC